MTDVGPVERAFQLARSGQCASIDEIGQRLRADGYIQVTQHLAGSLIRKQLRLLLA